MDIYRILATLKQGREESIHEYFERFNYYLDCCPYHGFQLHELMKYYLDGLCLGERTIMDIMAGGSIMERTPEEVWYLIQDRTADTRSCVQYLMLSREELEYQRAAAEHMFNQKEREAAEARIREEEAYQLAAKERIERARIYAAQCQAELDKKLAELDELEKIMKNKRELKSAPEPVQTFRNDEEVKLPIEEQATEDVVEEELQVVQITSVEDVPTEEWSTPQCSDLIIKQDTVITCSPIILPISDILVSPHVQNDTIQKALRNIQVWGSLQMVKIHTSIVRTPITVLNLEQFLESLCINWKFRKKRGDRMRGSLGKTISCTHSTTQRREKLHNGLRKTWKRRKKGKRNLLNGRPMFSVFLQESHYSTFGWKPGWNSWENFSNPVARKARKAVRKFDGVHPWAPNIC